MREDATVKCRALLLLLLMPHLLRGGDLGPGLPMLPPRPRLGALEGFALAPADEKG